LTREPEHKDLPDVSESTYSRGIEIREAKDAGEFDAVLATATPYERAQGIEVLRMTPEAVDLSRAKDGLPLLAHHDQKRLAGRVTGVRLKDGKLVGCVKFFDTGEGRDALAAVREGHRDLSVGYSVETTQQGTGATYYVTRWMPYEASFVAIGADPNAGIGRSFSVSNQDQLMDINTTEAEELDSSNTTRSQRRAAARVETTERERTEGISGIARGIPGMADLAMRAINEGQTIEQFQQTAIRHLSTKPIPTNDISGPYVQTNRHDGKYSLGRAIQSIVDPAAYMRTAGFEREISQELERSSVRETRGIRVPASAVFGATTRALLTSGSAGNTVETSVLGMSLVEVLRVASIPARMGSTTLSGLQGNVSIPRQTASASVSWVAENTAPTASDPTFDAISLTPKTMGAMVDMSRRVKIQSNVDIEGVVTSDLAAALLSEYDRAAMFGTGASNQPRGIANTSGIGSVVGGTNGLALAWTHVLDLERKVAELNAIGNVQNTGYAINFATRAKLKQVPKASGVISDMVMNDMPADSAGLYSLNGYKTAISSALPSNGTKGTGTALSTLIFGDWSQLFAAVWGALDLMVDPYSLSSVGGLRLVGLMDVDFALRHPQSFATMTDAITV
jgi:HK97 family phage major capsid protein